jgi:hypothetical protein
VGETLTFGLILVGQSITYLPYFIAVFRELGRVGLGHNRGRYRLRTVEAISPDNEAGDPIYQADDELIRPVDLSLTAKMITDRAAQISQPSMLNLQSPRKASNLQSLTLHFLTPTRLKEQGRWVSVGPPFPVLIRTLLGRISSLSYFHCGKRLEVDFRGLIDQAGAVRLKESQTRWEDWDRFSGRQKQRIRMGGLVGRVIYEGNLEPYLPLLAVGELVHVGKGTVFGNGQYRIEP